MEEINSQPKPLPGFVCCQKKDSGIYGIWFNSTYFVDGKVRHGSLYLGKVVNQLKGLFYRDKIGYFTFTTENGFGKPYNLGDPSVPKYPVSASLHFGDIWMVDQIFKQSGLDAVMENLIPGSGDTVKALVAYRLLKNDAYCYAKTWYERSYACLLYPNANLDSPRISEFQEILGLEANYRRFFSSYLEVITKNDKITEQISLPILIDSTGLPNDIKTHLTATKNHNGVVSNEIRLIYIVDQKTKLPIYFRYMCGNIIDNSTLIATINMLKAYYVDIKLVIMDAGDYCSNDLEQLILNDIPFVTRMVNSRIEYKQLMDEHSKDLKNQANAILYGERVLFVKKVPTILFNTQLYAYIMLDLEKACDEENKSIIKIIKNENKSEKFSDTSEKAGKFILLSTLDYDTNEILPLYYTRQNIEQVFDISKTYCGILPLRGHTEETIRGILLISFLSTAVYSYITHALSRAKLSTNSALIRMGNSIIKIYEDTNILEELTKDQKQIFEHLHLECPFVVEEGNPLQKKSFLSNLYSKDKKRGRPKGSKNAVNKDLQQELHKSESSSKKGCPKGSKNKLKKNSLPKENQ
jgi:hypothetical protein